MFSHSLIPQITKPTRITPITATLIDNIYRNDILSECNQRQGIVYSDHLLIFILTTLNNDKQDCVTRNIENILIILYPYSKTHRGNMLERCECM